MLRIIRQNLKTWKTLSNRQCLRIINWHIVKKAMHMKQKQNRLLPLDDYIKKSIFVFALLGFISKFSRIPPNPHRYQFFLADSFKKIGD
jgi:hypothetical protein